MFLYALIAGSSIALIALIGAFMFRSSWSSGMLHRFVLPAAVGVFLGVIFFELLPETFEASPEWGPLAVVLGFLGFYLLSHFLSTFHHHHADDGDTCLHDGARMLLIGDSVHNVADGIVIASAFMVNPALGVVTTIGIALHEIPQEIAEFGILLRSGCARGRALLLNLFSASSILLGIVLTFLFAHTFTEYVFVLTGIAAGNLLFIAATDLLPELRQSHREHFKTTFLATLGGLVVIASLIMYTHEHFGGHEHEEVDAHLHE